MFFLTGFEGELGYHRLFTHRSFETIRPIKFILGMLRSMAVEGPLLKWAALHRRHHRLSNTKDDLHSPNPFGTGLVAMLAPDTTEGFTRQQHNSNCSINTLADSDHTDGPKTSLFPVAPLASVPSGRYSALMAEVSENGGTLSVRDRLLDAAEQVVARDGAGNMTLEAVAREASVSKGGLLYHFPSKAALVIAIVERLANRCEQEQSAAMASDPEPAGAFTRAYLTTRAKPPDPQKEPVHTAVLAAFGTDPHYLDPIRKRLAEWQARLECDGIDPTTASIVRLAMDGLVLGRLLSVPLPEGELRQQVIERLRSMTRPEDR